MPLGTAIKASLIETESKEFATGSLSSAGGGDSVMTGLGTASTANAVTSVSVSAQPSVTISSGNDGDVEVMTDMDAVTVSANDTDEVTAITALGAATAAAQAISVNSDDKKKVALYNDLSVSAS
mgnify:CR=1 FL=1